jgi:hypothetical protein
MAHASSCSVIYLASDKSCFPSISSECPWTQSRRARSNCFRNGSCLTWPLAFSSNTVFGACQIATAEKQRATATIPARPATTAERRELGLLPRSRGAVSPTFPIFAEKPCVPMALEVRLSVLSRPSFSLKNPAGSSRHFQKMRQMRGRGLLALALAWMVPIAHPSITPSCFAYVKEKPQPGPGPCTTLKAVRKLLPGHTDSVNCLSMSEARRTATHTHSHTLTHTTQAFLRCCCPSFETEKNTDCLFFSSECQAPSLRVG